MTEDDGGTEPRDSNRGLGLLCLLAAVAGVGVGFVGGAFRWCLIRADELRQAIVNWAHHVPYVGWLVPVLLVALCTVLAVLIVRRVPLAKGSGIQHVEAVSRGEAKPPGINLVPARFIGGLLAIGSGLVLGREGPTVHMGAAIGAEAGRRARLTEPDVAMLQTSTAGAGLAVAFNAPIAGALFVCEEVTHSFRLRTVLPTLFGVSVAVGCARIVIGDQPDFEVGTVPTPHLALLPLFVVFGILTGLLGIAYNRLILGLLDIVARLDKIPPTVIGATIGAVIGLTLFLDPLASGGGDVLAQMIVGGRTFVLPILLLYLVVRFFTGPLSYAAGTPGGLFAPLTRSRRALGVDLHRTVELRARSGRRAHGHHGHRRYGCLLRRRSTRTVHRHRDRGRNDRGDVDAGPDARCHCGSGIRHHVGRVGTYLRQSARTDVGAATPAYGLIPAHGSLQHGRAT